MIDLLWMSKGGLLLDGTGDLASTDDVGVSVVDITRSRLKAALNGWKLYAFGADLQSLVGETVNPEIEVTLQRQVYTALTDNFLPRAAVTVTTLAYGDTIRVLVYLSQTLLAQAVIANSTKEVTVL
jgi:phage baseplate assembly protein W